jgi:zinc transport system permease protein
MNALAWLAEPFAHPFLVRAMAAGALVAALCATLGVFVVQRGLSYIGDGLAHATFGGIALGLLIGVSTENMIWAALPFTVLIAFGITKVLRRGTLGGDVATGVLSSASFALGVILMGLRPADAPPVNVETVLFGSLLAVSPQDLWVVGAVAVVAGGLVVANWGRLAYLTFDPELAALSGVNVRVFDYLLLSLTAAVIVVAVKTVGVALVSSFMIIPAATARMIGSSFGRVALIALALGVVGSQIGLFLSYHLNVASGATIILTLGALFGAAWPLRRRG